MVDGFRGGKTTCLGSKCAAWVFSADQAGFGGCGFIVGPQPHKSIVAPAIKREDDHTLVDANRGGKHRR